MHRVIALAIPRVVVFDLAIPAQIFGHPDEADHYAFAVCSPVPGSVESTTGFAIETQLGLPVLATADTIVVPGFDQEGPLDAAIIDALQAAHQRGVRITSVCTGAFALAAAGLLDGLRATTHWRNAPALQTMYPKIEVDPDVLYIDHGSVATSAGVAAGIDLCLALVRRDCGEARANRVARRMVVAPHRQGGQAQYIERPVPETGELSALCAWALRHLDQTLTVPALARRAGWSERTFTRRFLAETGLTPLRWLTAQRVALARELLESTNLGIEEIADRCGLGSPANLRTHFARDSATTPSDYRKTFRAQG